MSAIKESVPKSAIKELAANKGVAVRYSGKEQPAFIKGEDKAVKSFIRICNLKGKGYFGFKIAQA